LRAREEDAPGVQRKKRKDQNKGVGDWSRKKGGKGYSSVKKERPTRKDEKGGVTEQKARIVLHFCTK